MWVLRLSSSVKGALRVEYLLCWLDWLIWLESSPDMLSKERGRWVELSVVEGSAISLVAPIDITFLLMT